MRKNSSDKIKNEVRLDSKIIDFSAAKKYYGKLIDKKADEGDLVGALSLAFSMLKNEFSEETLADIADIYADMGEYELSDEYWMKYYIAAPEDKKSIAFEELAINAFETKNYGLSGYYLNKKIAADGTLSRKDLGQEMMDFLSEGINKKDLYKIVYPEERSDYSTEITFAKNAAAIGDFEAAIAFLSGIPENSPSYKEAAEEKSLAHFALGEADKAIKINRDLIAKFGKSASVCLNLASMYKYEKNNDKSEFYYSLAKEIGAGEDDMLKFALCAMEQGDHEAAAKYFGKVIDDEFYDSKVIGFYGLSLLNCKRFTEAVEMLKRAYVINPSDTVIAYYTRLAIAINEGESSDEYLPVPYNGELLKTEKEKRLKALSKSAGKTEGKKAKDKERIYEYIRWGLKETGTAFKKSLAAAVNCFDAEKEEMLKDALISRDVSAGYKQAIIFMMITTGLKVKINATSGGVLFSFKIRKLPCEEDAESPFFLAYATALSKMAFSGENMDKIAFCCNDLYKNRAGDAGDLNHSELAAAIIIKCGFESFKSAENALGIFGLKRESAKKITDFINGEK